MIAIKILLFATYRDLVDAKEVDIPLESDGTVRSLLQSLITQYPQFQDELFTDESLSQMKPHVHLFVNGRNIIHLKGLETTILGTEEIAMIPPVGGG